MTQAYIKIPWPYIKDLHAQDRKLNEYVCYPKFWAIIRVPEMCNLFYITTAFKLLYLWRRIDEEYYVSEVKNCLRRYRIPY